MEGLLYADLCFAELKSVMTIPADTVYFSALLRIFGDIKLGMT